MPGKVYTADEVEWMLRHLDDEITGMATEISESPGHTYHVAHQAKGLDAAARVVANMAHYIHDLHNTDDDICSDCGGNRYTAPPCVNHDRKAT